MTNPDDILELIFLPGGKAELRAFSDPDDESDGTLIWASDWDLDFRDQHSEEFLGVDDAETILTYLIESEKLDADEAEYVDIIEESLEGEDVKQLADIDPGDDDEGDEDDDEGGYNSVDDL